jgi:hypothetical protein
MKRTNKKQVKNRIEEFIVLTIIFIIMIITFIASLQIINIILQYSNVSLPILFAIVIIMLKKELKIYLKTIDK